MMRKAVSSQGSAFFICLGKIRISKHENHEGAGVFICVPSVGSVQWDFQEDHPDLSEKTEGCRFFGVYLQQADSTQFLIKLNQCLFCAKLKKLTC